ncbi:MAG: sialidase family protein [Pirellulaceae bacterium]
MQQRRRFLLKTAQLSAALLGGSVLKLHAGEAADARANVKSTPDVVIYEGTYPGWPWVSAGEDGTLYCVFREGVRHGFSAEGKIMLCVSRAAGKSWSAARVLIDEPGVDDRNVAITALKNGKLLLVYNTYTEEKKSQTLGSFSSDGGKTWSKPTTIGPAETRTRAAAVELSDGSILLPFYKAPGNGSLAARSTDAGTTWQTVEIPNREKFTGDEWDVLEVEAGRLIGILRNNFPEWKGYFWVTESGDFGETWSVPLRTNLLSKRYPSPAEITLQNGKPTVIYPDRRMVSVAAATTSDPKFVTWNIEGQLPCYQYEADGTAIPDGSYLSSVSVSKNRRLLVDYEVREDSHRITGYFVDFPSDW